MSEAREYYDEKSTTYDSQQRLLYFKVYDLITWRYTKPYIPTGPSAKVLDAAGGTGKWSIPIALEGPQVVLVDLSDGMLDVAGQKVRSAGLSSRIAIHHGDITSLDFEDETFDMVFCDHALCFVEDAIRAVKELARVLKKNSPMVISAQNRYPLSLSIFSQDFKTGAGILLGQERFLMRGRVPVHTLFPDDFRALLEANGVRVTRLIGKGIILTPLVLPTNRFWTEDYDQDLLNRVTDLELQFCERSDALALAGHIHAVGIKSPGPQLTP